MKGAVCSLVDVTLALAFGMATTESDERESASQPNDAFALGCLRTPLGTFEGSDLGGHNQNQVNVAY